MIPPELFSCLLSNTIANFMGREEQKFYLHMLDSVFICKNSVGYTLASSSVSGFLSVACDGGPNPYPHLYNKQVNHTTYHYQSIYGVYI